MRIKVSKQLPPRQDLVKILKQEFPNRYSCKLFGLGKKSIMVGKSTFVGAEISLSEREVSVSYSPPSVFAGLLMGLANTELGILLLPFFWFSNLLSKGREFEKEVGTFFLDKYGRL